MLHLTSFWFYFISYFVYYLLYSQNRRSGFAFETILLFTVLAETFSAVVLTYIIWEIYCISLFHQSKDQMPTRLQLSSERMSSSLLQEDDTSSINSQDN